MDQHRPGGNASWSHRLSWTNPRGLGGGGFLVRIIKIKAVNPSAINSKQRSTFCTSSPAICIHIEQRYENLFALTAAVLQTTMRSKGQWKMWHLHSRGQVLFFLQEISICQGQFRGSTGDSKLSTPV